MSKPVARIVFSVLISLAIVAGIYTTVYGAAFHGASSGRIQVTAGLMPVLHHYRLQASTVNGYSTGLTEEKPANKVHDCDFDSNSALDD